MKFFDRKRLRHLAALLLAGGFFVPSFAWGLNTITTGFQTTVVDTKIDAHASCFSVSHSGSDAYFIPTKASTEWEAFRSSAPADVELLPCSLCRYDDDNLVEEEEEFCYSQNDDGYCEGSETFEDGYWDNYMVLDDGNQSAPPTPAYLQDYTYSNGALISTDDQTYYTSSGTQGYILKIYEVCRTPI